MLATLPLALALQSAAPAPAPAPAPMPPLEEARRRIEARDARLFWAGFEGCDPAALEELLTPDFRMLHDRAGLAVSSRDHFVAMLTEQCAARAPGGENEGYRNRRLPVPGTRIVRLLGDWGVLEEGAHVFFEWGGEARGWVMVGGARYMHSWQWVPDEGVFRLSESLSYDHGAAAPYPPGAANAGGR